MDATMIRDALKEHFGPHAVPKEIYFGEDIPLLGIGKPDRRTLRTKFERLDS